MVANHLLKIIAKGWLPGSFLEGTLTQTLSYSALTALCSLPFVPQFFFPTSELLSFDFKTSQTSLFFEQYVKPRFPEVSNSSTRRYKSNSLSAQGRKYAHRYDCYKLLQSKTGRPNLSSFPSFQIPASGTACKSPLLQDPLGQKVVQKDIPSAGSHSGPLPCALTYLATYAGTWFRSVVWILALSCRAQGISPTAQDDSCVLLTALILCRSLVKWSWWCKNVIWAQPSKSSARN